MSMYPQCIIKAFIKNTKLDIKVILKGFQSSLFSNRLYPISTEMLGHISELLLCSTRSHTLSSAKRSQCIVAESSKQVIICITLCT